MHFNNSLSNHATTPKYIRKKNNKSYLGGFMKLSIALEIYNIKKKNRCFMMHCSSIGSLDANCF